jgi:hypothetical protein
VPHRFHDANFKKSATVRNTGRSRVRQGRRFAPRLEESLERRELLAPFPVSGTFSGQYHDTSISTYSIDGLPPQNDSGTLTLSINVVSRQSDVAVVGGTLTLTGYPNGTISLTIEPSEGIWGETRSGSTTSITFIANQGNLESEISVFFTGVFKNSSTISGQFVVTNDNTDGYSTSSPNPDSGTPVVLVSGPSVPQKPHKGAGEKTGLVIDGSPDEKRAFNEMLDQASSLSGSFRSLLQTIREDADHPVLIRLVGRDKPGLTIDSFDTKQVSLVQLELLPASPPPGSDDVTQGEEIAHILEERYLAAIAGISQSSDPRFSAAHNVANAQQNLFRLDLGQNLITSFGTLDDETVHGTLVVTIGFDDEKEEQLTFGPTGKMTISPPVNSGF